MKQTLSISKKAFNALEKLTKKHTRLEWVQVDGKKEINWVDEYVTPTILVDEGRVTISAEDGKGWADYYCEFGGDEIAPELEAWATKYDCTIEWENPGVISVWAN